MVENFELTKLMDWTLSVYSYLIVYMAIITTFKVYWKEKAF